jgi:hypothetical protein
MIAERELETLEPEARDLEREPWIEFFSASLAATAGISNAPGTRIIRILARAFCNSVRAALSKAFT